MKIVVFGLSVTSSWGNGHATLLRGLFRALHSMGHKVHFFERDTPYYALHRDSQNFPDFTIHLYSDWKSAEPEARRHLIDADIAMVTSYCQNGREASSLICEIQPWRKVFFDMDTPVTLSELGKGKDIPYLPAEGLAGFDTVLSYTGGLALDRLRSELGAHRAAALYGWGDPAIHYRVPPQPEFEARLSYLGTYAADRQDALEELFIRPAQSLHKQQFLIGGALYPETQIWPANIRFVNHVAPPEHPAFYSSSSLTLNITRASMAALGYCPSGRLFEAAACGTPVVSDYWEGIDTFFKPGDEILLVRNRDEAIDAITRSPQDLCRIGARARERALSCHTAELRAKRMIGLIDQLVDESCLTSGRFELTAGQA